MNISIDLGNVWEALSAVGTIGAVIISLWLARRDERRKLTVQVYLSYGMKHDNTFENESYISIDTFNEGKRPIIIEEVGFVKRKRGRKLTIIDSTIFKQGSSGLNYKVDSNLSAMYILELENIKQSAQREWGEKVKIRAYVRDSSGKKHFSKRHKIW